MVAEAEIRSDITVDGMTCSACANRIQRGDGAVSIGAYPVANADRILLSVEGEWQVLDFG